MAILLESSFSLHRQHGCVGRKEVERHTARGVPASHDGQDPDSEWSLEESHHYPKRKDIAHVLHGCETECDD